MSNAPQLHEGKGEEEERDEQQGKFIVPQVPGCSVCNALSLQVSIARITETKGERWVQVHVACSNERQRANDKESIDVTEIKNTD